MRDPYTSDSKGHLQWVADNNGQAQNNIQHVACCFERAIKCLGSQEGRQRQTMLTDSLQMTETIRVFAQTNLKDNILPQNGVLYPQGASVKDLETEKATAVVKNMECGC